MTFRLRNANDPYQTLALTSAAWCGILDLAEEYGWNPIGTVAPGQWFQNIYDYALAGYYLGHPVGWNEPEDENVRLVMIEDALNLADALEQAFMDYEPLRVPASFYLFEPEHSAAVTRPSIGAINAVIEFCRMGAFKIEPYQHDHRR